MLDLYIFLIIAAMILAAAVSVLISRKLIYSVISISVVFLGSALVFFLIGQTMIALLQLIVFVGGFSTFLIVSLASEEKNSRLINAPYFIVLALIFFAGLWYTTSAYVPAAGASSSSFLNAAASAFGSGYATFYIIAMLLFAVALSGVFIIKKFTRLLV